MKNFMNSLLKTLMKHRTLLLAAFVFTLMCCCTSAYASTGAGGGLPWEKPLETFINAITGKTAILIIILAAFILIVMLIFNQGADYGQVFKMLGYVILGGSVLVGVSSLVLHLFGKGALV